MSFRTFLTGAVFITLLSGCVSLSTPDLQQSWQGRFSISAESAQHRENHSGRFILTHSSAPLTILDLKTALGNTIARVTLSDTDVSLQTVGRPEYRADNVDNLLIQTLGFSVPVEGLQYWLEGSPIVGVSAQTTPQSKPYKEIQQNGWLIRYESYDAKGLPKRIRFEREASIDSPALSILLLISDRHHDS